MLIQAGSDQDGEDGSGGGAEDEQDDDTDQNHDEHPLLRTVEGLPPQGPGGLALEDRSLLYKEDLGKCLETKLKMSKLESTKQSEKWRNSITSRSELTI